MAHAHIYHHWRNRQNQGRYRHMAEIRIGIVLYPGAQLSAAMGLTDLFEIAGRMGERSDQGAPRLRVQTLQPDATAAFAAEGTPEAPESDDIPCHVLILPPSLEAPIKPDIAAPLAGWLRKRHGEGTVLASVCGGAFLLAETGLLCGRAATTHWTYAEDFHERFAEPDVEVVARALGQRLHHCRVQVKLAGARHLDQGRAARRAADRQQQRVGLHPLDGDSAPLIADQR